MSMPPMYPYRMPRVRFRFRLRRNRLRRGSDWVERAAVAVALVLVPVAPVVGVTVGQHALATAAATSAGRTVVAQRTTAVLVEDAPRQVNAPMAGGQATSVQVQAVWQAPDGSSRSGPVTASGTSLAGQAVALWMDSSGTPTAAPASAREQRLAAIAAGTGGGLGWLILLAGFVGAVRWMLGRRRLRNWGDEWAAVEHSWRRELL
jgi:hypothetical protein